MSMKLITSIAALALLAPVSASASHKTPLYRAACEYRDATRHFWKAVIHAPHFDHHQERIVARLADAAAPLPGWSHHPEHHYARMVGRWHEIQIHQEQAHCAIFDHPRCPSVGDLYTCWERVKCAGVEFRRQLSLCGPVAPVRTCATPPSAVGIPPAIVRSFPRTVLPYNGFGNSFGRSNDQFRTPVSPQRVDPVVPSYRSPQPSRTPVHPGVGPHFGLNPGFSDRHDPGFREFAAIPNADPIRFDRRYRGTREVNPHWNSSRIPAGRREMQSPVSYRGVDAASLMAMIARFID